MVISWVCLEYHVLDVETLREGINVEVPANQNKFCQRVTALGLEVNEVSQLLYLSLSTFKGFY